MKKDFITAAVSLALFASPLVVFADGTGTGGSTSHQVINPLGGVTSICGLIKALLGAAIAIGIPIAVLFIVYAGLLFVLARGNSEKLADARQNMLYVVIGIAIFLGAWLLASVIANTVNALQAGSGQSSVISCN